MTAKKPSLDLDALGVTLTDGELVAADRDLHGIPQGSDLTDVNGGAFGDPHIHDAAAQRPLAVQWRVTVTVCPIFAFQQCAHRFLPPFQAGQTIMRPGHALAQGDAGVLDVDDKVPAHFGHDGDLSALYKTQAFQEAAGFVLPVDFFTVVTVPEGAIVNGMITTTSLKK